MTTVCSKKGCEGKYRTFRKPPLFGKNGKGLAHRFGQKMKIFNPLRFLIMNSPNMSLELYDYRLFSKKDVRANVGKFENRPFLEKMARG